MKNSADFARYKSKADGTWTKFFAHVSDTNFLDGELESCTIRLTLDD